jgi:hypothetical protein
MTGGALTMDAGAKSALCTALAIAAFAGGYLSAGLTWESAGALSVAVLVASWIAVPRRREAAEIEVAPGVSKSALDQALLRIRTTADAFDQALRAVSDTRVASAVQSLSRLSRSIADDLEQDPKDLRRAWEFVDYQVSQAARIVDSYARLDRAPDKSEEEAHRLAAVGHAILEIETLFAHQLRALRADDFDQLSEDVTAMKTIALRLDAMKLPVRTASGN